MLCAKKLAYSPRRTDVRGWHDCYEQMSHGRVGIGSHSSKYSVLAVGAESRQLIQVVADET